MVGVQANIFGIVFDDVKGLALGCDTLSTLRVFVAGGRFHGTWDVAGTVTVTPAILCRVGHAYGASESFSMG